MNENINDNWIGLEEAANYLGVKKETVRTWIKKTDKKRYGKKFFI